MKENFFSILFGSPKAIIITWIIACTLSGVTWAKRNAMGFQDTSNITDMSHKFKYASQFNQPIGKWNVSNVENMKEMLENASSFDQDLSAWDVSNVKNAKDIFYQSGLSQENYCKMITTNTGWKRLSKMFH